MIYFDNSATTYKKPLAVKIATYKGLKAANPGRSGHRLSFEAAQMVFKTRLLLQTFFNVKRQEDVIFTQNCTEALNLAILGTKQKGNVIASCFEHNSVLRPLKHLEKQGLITLTIACPKENNIITKEDIEPLITTDTYMVCVSYINNTLGNKNDISKIGKLCKEKNILFLVDCAQSAGHINIDMQKDNINLLTFAGHKGFFAPQSIGGLCINDAKVSPIKFGGSGTNSDSLDMPSSTPESLESGTLSCPLIFGLNAGVNYVLRHFDKHTKKVANLTKYLIDKLESIGANIYTNKNSRYGVVLFNLKNIDSTELSQLLDEKYNIMVRGGLHCAALAHKYLGTLKTGAVRASINHYNTKRQIDKFIYCLKDILNK